MSAYDGTVALKMGGTEYTLVMDWAALADVQTKHGENCFEGLYAQRDLKKIADMVAAAAKRHHPELTAKKVLELSPPLIGTLKVLDEVLAIAYFGAEQAAELKQAAEKVEEGDEKKTE